MINITIDGICVKVDQKNTILQIANKIGIKIPTLCYIKQLLPYGSCRMCVVEIENNGKKRIDTACSYIVNKNDIIYTKSKKIIKFRKFILNLLLSNHNINCFSCYKNGQCKLQDYCIEYNIEKTSFNGQKSNFPIDDSNPFFIYDPNKCILCHKCINVCNKIVCRGAINVINRGFKSIIKTSLKKNFINSICESCGNCVEICPTGALVSKRKKIFRKLNIDKKVLTTCPHCATGCQFYLIIKDNKIIDTEPFNGQSNKKLLCVKGRNGSFDFVHSIDRIKYPLIKDKKTNKFKKVNWDYALNFVAKKIMNIKKQYGSESLAGFACSRSPNEDIYMVQKMVRTCFGTNNVDNCARVCHSASVAGLAMTLGSGAMTNTIEDITTKSDLIMIVGANPEEAHPVIGMQIRRAIDNGCKLIVVDPRNIDLSKKADIHLKLKPGTNVAFANGFMHVIIEEGLQDINFIKNRTEGYENIKKIVKKYTPEIVSKICHISPNDLKKAAIMYAKANRAPIIYCLGVTEHSTGTEGVMSMSNIALLVGKLGKQGCGVNPIRGQNNVQGACDMGASPKDYPGYQKVENINIRKKFEKAWNIKLNSNNGLHSTEVFPSAINGKIKGLYIYGEDPIVTDPDTNHIIKALKNLDFFVIQELFMTETAKYADVILPGVSYAEKEGTFTNTERRIQRVRKAIEHDKNTRLDTDIIIDLMNKMGYKQKHLNSSEIMDEIASLTPIYGGISHSRLDNGETLQWPCPNKYHPGTPILHVNKFSRGIAKFYPAEYIQSAELTDNKYPIIMMTGRMLYHYTTRAMTGKTYGLVKLQNKSYIEINYKDAKNLGINNNDKVKISSRRGQIISIAKIGNKVSQGEAWMPFHFPDGNANWLTNAALDKYAKIPEYKVCAIKIEKA